ncbi:MAG: apolipoprotein N-acyltransferase [Mariprofundaceae bacterium]|nr:apolipoprotein N-acyltransferase [Mariprofundaceae bacterium]
MALAFLCGACMQFSFSPYDIWWLALLLPALVLWLAQRAYPFSHGYAFGVGWFGVGSWWLIETFYLYGGLPYWVGVLIVAFIGLIMCLFPALWFALACRLARRSLHILWLFPVSVVLLEWLRGHLFTGLPWTALGNILLDTPAIGWASVVGVYGLAALPALCIAALAIFPAYPRHAAAALLLTLALFFFAPAPFLANGKTYTAALIQGNVPQDQKWDAAFLAQTLDHYIQLSSAVAKHADVIVWPESAVPFFPSRMPDWDQWLQGKMMNLATVVLYGGDRLLALGGEDAQSGLYAFVAGKRTFSGKQHLVPFGEYVPSWLPFIRTIIPAIANFKPANGDGVLYAEGIGYGTLICYESIFPEQARDRINHGAEVLIVASNDAWYGHSPAVWQHTQAARMRAVETGRYLLRVGNTGITAVIAPDARIMDQLPWWQSASLTAPFQTSTAITPYVRWGDMPVLLLACLLLILAVVFRWTSTNNMTQSRP